MDSDPDLKPLKSITFKLSGADIERLRRIARKRYPEDQHTMGRVLREMIRRTYEQEVEQTADS